MTDNERADRVRELLETAESMLSEMDVDADSLVAVIKQGVESALADLEHIDFDEWGNIVPVDDDEDLGEILDDDEDDEDYDDDDEFEDDD